MFCLQIEESIVAKWESLDAKQKSKYELTIATRCSPKTFKDTICMFSKEKKEVIDELGFDVLAQLGCSNLNRELCQMLVENFDPINMCIQIHGKTISIGPQDFERIMGVRDGGVTVDITGSIDDKDIKKMTKIYAQGGNKIKIINLQKYVNDSEKADDTFKVGVTLFVVATLLCPTVLDTVHPKFLLPFRDAKAIRAKNLATFSFFHLVEGVKSFKLRGSGFMDGCLLFLQLFYFDVISHGDTIVNKSLSHVVVAWGDEEARKLFKYVSENGGVHSTTLLVVKPHVDTKHLHQKYYEVCEDEAITKADVIDLKANMSSFTVRIDQMDGSMEQQMIKMNNMQESISRMEHTIINLETKLLDSLVEKVSKSLASKGEIPKERVMFPIEISSDGCLRNQQSRRNDPPLIHNISSEHVGDHISVPVPQNEV